MRIAVAAIGNTNDVSTFGGTPYYCLQAGLSNETLVTGLDLSASPSRLSPRHIAWAGLSAMRTGSVRGYQYSQSFLEAIWRGQRFDGIDCVLNLNQLFPESLFGNDRVRKWLYIDQTLNQLINYYEFGKILGRRACSEIIASERAQLNRVDGIIVTSKWAASDVVASYGIDKRKVFIVPRGANIDCLAMERFASKGYNRERDVISPSRDCLRLVFVGKDWQRKGLDRLLRAIPIARENGAKVELTVIGVDRSGIPASLAGLPGVAWLGYLDKSEHPDRYIESVSACDVGCLLSLREAGGISLREFHWLGLATIAPDTGGAPEFALAAATTLIQPEAPDGEVARVISKLAFDRQFLGTQKAASRSARDLFTWDHSTRQIGSIIRGATSNAEQRPLDK